MDVSQEFDTLINDYNDNALFSLRNLMIDFENKEISFSEGLDTILAVYFFHQLILPNSQISLIGFLDPAIESFHESLNTLEFCQKLALTIEYCHKEGIIKEYQRQQMDLL